MLHWVQIKLKIKIKISELSSLIRPPKYDTGPETQIYSCTSTSKAKMPRRPGRVLGAWNDSPTDTTGLPSTAVRTSVRKSYPNCDDVTCSTARPPKQDRTEWEVGRDLSVMSLDQANGVPVRDDLFDKFPQRDNFSIPYDRFPVTQITSQESEIYMKDLLEMTAVPCSSKLRQKPTIMWFRQDLRLTDNTALLAASQHSAVIPVFLYSEPEEGLWPLGGAAKYWLHQSLTSLSASLESRYGSRLIIREGADSLSLLLSLLLETGAASVHFNRVYEPWKLRRDAEVQCRRMSYS